VIAAGPPDAVSSHPDVIKAYLGEEHAVVGAGA
jgi:ABC-type branched-subunit amino acid transport system ATPase component